MDSNDRYEVIPVDGSVFNLADNPDIPYLHFCGLNWDEAVLLCHLSLEQEFQEIVWRREVEDDGKAWKG